MKIGTSDSRWNLWWLIIMITMWPLISMAMDAGEYLDDAQEYFDQGEYRTAVIQLKNALQAEPDNKEARLLLGKTYLKLEDGPSALKELSRARDLGVPRELVLVPLGQACLMSGETDKLLQTITPEADDPLQIKIDILLLHGQAYLGRQQFDMADEKFSKVLELQPAAAEALAGKARIAFHNRDMAGAAELADKALAEDDQMVDAWVVKGQLLRDAGNQQEALSAFQKALDIAPSNVPARLGKSMSLIALGEDGKAGAEMDQLLQRNPNLFMAHYVKALALYQQHQLIPAQESVQRALNLAPGHIASHLLSGTIDYQQGHLNQAEEHLRRVLNQRPDDKQAAKLLAATLLKLKEPGEALDVLTPGISSAMDDLQYLSLLGGAYLGMGDAVKGLEYMEKAIALAPELASIRTQLALGLLALGEDEKAIGELQTAVDLNQGLPQADALLVMTYLRNKDFDNALIAAEAYSMKMPDSPVPLNMKGAAYFGKGDYKAASNSYEAAVGIQPDFLPAYINLAQLDLLANDPNAAKIRYQKVLSYDEGNLKALLALAALANYDGQTGETEKWLKQACDHHPEATQPALMLAEYYLRQGETQKAEDWARKTSIAHPQDQQALKTLAHSQLQAGEDKEALKTLRSLVDVAPKSPEAYYLLSLVQLKLKKSEEARESLREALNLQADYPAAQLALGRFYISGKKFDDAFDIANDLKQAHPDAVFGYELEGDIFYARQQFKEASGVYTLAYGKANSGPIAQKLFQTHLRAGEQDAAYDALRQWLARQPQDIQTRSLLATALQSAGQQQQAIDEYLKILEDDGENLTALNNIAWLYQETGKIAEARRYAEHAHELAPDKPEITDTLGWILVQNGDTNRGLVLLQEARVKAPHIPEIHFHMAVALAKAGRVDESRKELDRLLKTGKDFQGVDEARKLREQLGG